jgi:hypothetical protein
MQLLTFFDGAVVGLGVTGAFVGLLVGFAVGTGVGCNRLRFMR